MNNNEIISKVSSDLQDKNYTRFMRQGSCREARNSTVSNIIQDLRYMINILEKDFVSCGRQDDHVLTIMLDQQGDKLNRIYSLWFFVEDK